MVENGSLTQQQNKYSTAVPLNSLTKVCLAGEQDILNKSMPSWGATVLNKRMHSWGAEHQVLVIRGVALEGVLKLGLVH